MAWDTKNGFYVSTVVLDAPWESDLEALHFPKYDKDAAAAGWRKARKMDESYNNPISFKSIDGSSRGSISSKRHNDRGEHPEDYTWTDAYHNSPAIRSVIDWFKVEKTRTSVYQQVPGGHIVFHHDLDNQRLNFDSNKLTVRIWIQLSGEDCIYRLSNGDVDISVNLQRGQFIVLNADNVFHETWNHGSKNRNLLNITGRANSWLKNINEIWGEPQTIKTMEKNYNKSAGEKYVGDYKDGVRHGQGTYTYGPKSQWAGDKYVGEFKDGIRNGQGTYTHASGENYVGEWKDGKPNGQGTETNAYGKYVGEWKDGKKHVQGTETFANGEKYVGEYEDGVRHGQGTVTYSVPSPYAGFKYVGEFKNDTFHGQGTYTHASGEKYVGEFKDGKYNGQGTKGFGAPHTK
jgi:hypothetical protein